jgi:hypothetical protein
MSTPTSTKLPMLPRLLALVAPSLLATALLAPPASALAWGYNTTTGSGKLASETRTVAEFHGVAANGSVDLVVKQGPQAPVRIEADDNLLPIIETVVESGRHGPVLVVRPKKGTNYSTRNKVQVTVTIPKLTVVSVAGSGDAKIEPFTTTGALRLAVAGSGSIALDSLATDEISASIAGSGDIGGSGKAMKLDISIAGSGDVKLGGLRADEVKIGISGSGDAQVQAQKSLDVRIAGSGDVVYTGDATVKTSIAGSGEVKKR